MIYKKMLGNELAIGSVILLFFTVIGNLLSYVFQFAMARMLGPVDYGVLAVVTSIVAIFGIPTVAIQTVVSKYTTKFNVRGETGKINGIISYLVKRMILVAFVCFLVFSILSIFLSEVLGISYWLLVLTGLFIFGAFLYPITAGVLQGMKRFKGFGLNFVLNCLIKLLVAVVLVLAGMKVYGATLGFISGIIFSFLLAFPMIKDIRKTKKSPKRIRIFSGEVMWTFFAMLIIVLIYSLDVIFVKVFFSPDLAGKYSVISMIGKIILFLTISVGSVMFPINSEKFERGHATRGVLKRAVVLTLLIGVVAVIFFLIFPELIIKMLFGRQYLSLSYALVYVGVAFSFISLLNILILYKLSVERIRMFHLIWLSIFLALEVLLFIIFHNSIEQFSIAFMISSIISLFGGFVILKK